MGFGSRSFEESWWAWRSDLWREPGRAVEEMLAAVTAVGHVVVAGSGRGCSPSAQSTLSPGKRIIMISVKQFIVLTSGNTHTHTLRHTIITITLYPYFSSIRQKCC